MKVLPLGPNVEPAGPVRTLTRRPDDLREPAWSHSGQSVIYANSSYLWRVAADGSAEPERLDLAGIGATSPAIAPRHDRLAFVQERDRVSMHRLDMTSMSPPVLASSFRDYDAAFAPDGQRLAFTSSRSGEGPQIWTARADGSDARQLVRGAGTAHGSPAWSPDGRQIAFDSQHDDGSWSIFIVDADGGASRQLTMASGDENIPSWSRDGRWIYFTSDQRSDPTRDPAAGAVNEGERIQLRSRNVWRILATGGPPEPITSGGSGSRVVLSPDGSEVFYWPTDEPGPLLAVPAAGGAKPRQVLPCAADIATNVHGLYYIECGIRPRTRRARHRISDDAGPRARPDAVRAWLGVHSRRVARREDGAGAAAGPYCRLDDDRELQVRARPHLVYKHIDALTV